MERLSKNWWILKHAGISEIEIKKSHNEWFQGVKPEGWMEEVFVKELLKSKTGGWNNLRALNWRPADTVIAALSKYGDADTIEEQAKMWAVGLIESPTSIDRDLAFIGYMEKKHKKEVQRLYSSMKKN